MKRIFILLLIMMITLVGCGLNNTQDQENENDSLRPGEEYITVTVPILVLSANKEPESEKEVKELMDSIKKINGKEIEIIDDKNITFKISKSDHEKLKKDFHKFVTDLFDMIGEMEHDVFSEVLYDESLTELTYLADEEAYRESSDRDLMVMPITSIMFYYALDGIKPAELEMTVNVENKETKEVIEQFVYPEYYSELIGN